MSQRMKPGTHQVEVAKEGYEPWSGSVTVQAGKRARVDAVLKPSCRATPTPEPRRTWTRDQRLRGGRGGHAARRRLRGIGRIPSARPGSSPGERDSVRGHLRGRGEGRGHRPQGHGVRRASVVDEAVLAAVRNWKYAPGARRGREGQGARALQADLPGRLAPMAKLIVNPTSSVAARDRRSAARSISIGRDPVQRRGAARRDGVAAARRDRVPRQPVLPARLQLVQRLAGQRRPRERAEPARRRPRRHRHRAPAVPRGGGRRGGGGQGGAASLRAAPAVPGLPGRLPQGRPVLPAVRRVAAPPSAPPKAVCASCGTAVPLPARFCNACGTALPREARGRAAEAGIARPAIRSRAAALAGGRARGGARRRPPAAGRGASRRPRGGAGGRAPPARRRGAAPLPVAARRAAGPPRGVARPGRRSGEARPRSGRSSPAAGPAPGAARRLSRACCARRADDPVAPPRAGRRPEPAGVRPARLARPGSSTRAGDGGQARCCSRPRSATGGARARGPADPAFLADPASRWPWGRVGAGPRAVYYVYCWGVQGATPGQAPARPRGRGGGRHAADRR